jgi:hypothetical protein
MSARMWMVGLVIAGAVGWSALTAWAEAPPSTVEKSAPAPQTYSCPMHPQIRATFPGTCPLCRMTLKADAAPTTPTNHVEHAHPGMSMDGMGAMGCPHCTMGTSGMPIPAASAGGKPASSGYRTVSGRRCGC